MPIVPPPLNISFKRLEHVHAFTLIELLSVIAVIGVLTAILIPSVHSIRQKAYEANATSNLRQSTTGLLMLANANGGPIITRGGGNGNGPSKYPFWSEQLETELGMDRELFFDDTIPSGIDGNLRDRSGWA